MKDSFSFTKKIIAIFLSFFLILPSLSIAYAQEEGEEKESLKSRLSKRLVETDNNVTIGGVKPATSIYLKIHHLK